MMSHLEILGIVYLIYDLIYAVIPWRPQTLCLGTQTVSLTTSVLLSPGGTVVAQEVRTTERQRRFREHIYWPTTRSSALIDVQYRIEYVIVVCIRDVQHVQPSRPTSTNAETLVDWFSSCNIAQFWQICRTIFIFSVSLTQKTTEPIFTN